MHFKTQIPKVGKIRSGFKIAQVGRPVKGLGFRTRMSFCMAGSLDVTKRSSPTPPSKQI
jgi:hypothetical protein